MFMTLIARANLPEYVFESGTVNLVRSQDDQFPPEVSGAALVFFLLLPPSGRWQALM